MMRGLRVYIPALVATGVAMAPLARAERATTLPPRLQAAIFFKVFRYSSTLSAKGTTKVLIIAGEDDKDAQILKTTFRELGVFASRSEPERANQVLEAHTVLYVSSASSALLERCEKLKILTITGNVELVRRGDVGVGVGLKDGKPKILVNYTRVLKEGHEISSRVLRLAEVIR